MKAVIRRQGRLVVDDASLPAPGPGQVVCRTLACGICGSDLHALDHYDHMIDAYERAGMSSPLKKGRDVVFGHEFCCEVLENGPGVEGRFKAGDRVVSVPGLMQDGGFVSLGYSNEYPGGFAEQMLLSEMLMLPVPNGLSAEHAALTEPLAVGEHAVVKAGLEGGEVMLVVGCGPVGLAVIASLKARGLGPVVASDYSAERRAAAERMGADRIVDPGQVSPHAAWTELGVPQTRGEAMMMQMMGGSPKKAVVFECVGMPGVVQTLAQSAPDGTRIVVVGVCMETDRIEPLVLITKETELRFVFGYARDEFAQKPATSGGRSDPLRRHRHRRRRARRRARGVRAPAVGQAPDQDPGEAERLTFLSGSRFPAKIGLRTPEGGTPWPRARNAPTRKPANRSSPRPSRRRRCRRPHRCTSSARSPSR